MQYIERVVYETNIFTLPKMNLTFHILREIDGVAVTVYALVAATANVGAHWAVDAIGGQIVQPKSLTQLADLFGNQALQVVFFHFQYPQLSKCPVLSGNGAAKVIAVKEQLFCVCKEKGKRWISTRYGKTDTT